MKKAAKPRRRWLRRLIWTLILLLIFAGVGYYGYTALRQEYTVTYDSYTATTGNISNALSFSGNLSLIDSANYTAPSNTSVRRVYVAAGDEVSDGDELPRLSNGTTIRAEFDGRVNALNVAEGGDVLAGDMLIQVADFEHLQVSLCVTEYDIADVFVGQTCNSTATATERSFESEIASIDYISSSGGNVAYYTAQCYVDVDGGVYPGMQVTVSIHQEEADNVVVLNLNALSFDMQNSAYVRMYDENEELVQVPVEVGVSNGNYVEIVSGVSDGDVVYVEAEDDDSASGLSGLLSGLFGSRQFNPTQGGGTNRGNWNRGDSSSFGGNMPGAGTAALAAAAQAAMRPAARAWMACLRGSRASASPPVRR